jgi:hypothetical protein
MKGGHPKVRRIILFLGGTALFVNVSFPVCHPRPTPACPSEPLPSPWTIPCLKHPLPLRALHTAQHPSLRPPIVRLHAAVLTPTSQSQLHQDRNSFDLADDFWRYAHLWTKRFRWYRVHWNRWPLKAPHVCPKLLKRVWVCLCVTRAAESHVRFTTVVHPDMHICCSNNLHMLCICTRGGMGAQDR